MSHIPPDAARPDAVRSQTWQVTPDLMAVLGRDGYFADVNPAWTATLGWTEAEIKARPFDSFIHPDDMAASLGAFDRIRQGKSIIRFENRYVCKDGSYRWLSWVAVPEDGVFHCTARDVTAEHGAQEERDRLWALSEDMLARADYAGTMTAVNPAWTQVLGFTETELLTRPYAEFMHPEDAGKTLAALEAMGRTGLPTRFENRIRATDGSWKPIGWTVSPEPGGRYFIAVGRDLSDYKARERELLQAQEALRQAQKMEAVGQLTGGIAHDFNNLLAAISLSLEMLRKPDVQADRTALRKYLDTAQASVKRGATLTQRLLAFSRRQTLDPRPADASQLVAGMEELVARAVGPAVRVLVTGGDGLWQVNVDGPQLENALLNLCINARDAMPGGGTLEIATANRHLDAAQARAHDMPPGDYVVVAVTDTGTGMPPDVAARVFDPFFTTKPLGQGTGLGLSMVYGFVRQSGGQVTVDSALGRGTTMSMYFPRHLGAALHVPEASLLAEPAADGDGEVVVVIDDEEPIREVVAEVLGLAGYRVLQAADGPTGLKLLQAQPRVDLLVTDVGLPGGMNGRQGADAARAVKPDLRILFITGYAENAAVGNGNLETGMGILTKPFDIASLARKVESLLAT
ncbi:MAG: PAS domain S-box protein [Ramlibacter sp.]